MSDTQQNEIKNIGNMLAKMADIAEQASITGLYEGGIGRCIQQYNASVTRLEAIGAISPGFFQPLSAEAAFGEAGIACAQLASFIGGTNSTESGAIYHGAKYKVEHNHVLSKEERQEFKEIRELLHRLNAKKDEDPSL